MKPGYTSDWPVISRRVREAANWTCEGCGVAEGTHRRSRTSKVLYAVVLGVAHLDQNPSNNERSNLRCLCPTCHFKYDRQYNTAKMAAKAEAEALRVLADEAARKEIDEHLSGLTLPEIVREERAGYTARPTRLKDRILRERLGDF